jgi:transcriptional regulator with XRE-family HTH domain
MKSIDDELALASQKLLDTVSKNVVRLRQMKGYSQLDLALEIGLSGAAYLGRMEIRTKNHHFNLEHLAKIAEILEVDICEFFQPVEE